MDPLVVAILILGGICLALIIWLYRERKHFKTLMSIKEMLADELEKYRDMDGVLLTRREKGIMIMALTAPQVRKRISEPKTKHIDRKAYKTLLEKMKEAIKE